MPKISNTSISIHHKDIRKNFDVQVMYNQKKLFYIVVPQQFHEVMNNTSDEKLKELGVVKESDIKRNIGYEPSNSHSVSAASETECVNKMKKCLEYLVDQVIERRDVILVFYDPADNMTYSGHRHNEEHPQIGLRFGLTYAVETSVGDKKVYSTYSRYEAFGEMREQRNELSLWNRAVTIIPDTPENRQKLEQLYDAFAVLREKLKSITASPDHLLDFIASGDRLLPNSQEVVA